MTRYELLKFLHVGGAIAWVGGGLGLLLLTRRLVAAGDHAGVLALSRQSKAIGNVLFVPASLVTVASGITLVALEAGLAFTDLWILIGFGGIAASGAAQMVVAAPAESAFVTATADYGLDSPQVAAAARRLGLGNSLDVGLLLIVVWVMVAKPTL